MCSFCREQGKLRQKARKESGKCNSCGNIKDNNKKRCEDCLEKRRLKYKEDKKKIIDKYGGKCACCGEPETDFLNIDHVNNDGNEHRKELGWRSTGVYFYRWLKKNNYPTGFQVLCFNCNYSKHIGRGVCAHKRKI